MTRADLARAAGVSRGAITQAVSSGRVVVAADGSIDPANPLTVSYIATAKHQRRRGGSRAPKTQASALSVPPPSSPASVPTSERPPPSEGQAFGSPSGKQLALTPTRNENGDETYSEAERRWKSAQADNAELKAKKDRGELIPRLDVDKVFNQCWTIDSSELLTIAQQIAPELGAIFGVDEPGKVTAAQERLDLEIRSALDHSKAHMLKWLADRTEATA